MAISSSWTIPHDYGTYQANSGGSGMSEIPELLSQGVPAEPLSKPEPFRPDATTAEAIARLEARLAKFADAEALRWALIDVTDVLEGVSMGIHADAGETVKRALEAARAVLTKGREKT
jgi:hypothetical protein